MKGDLSREPLPNILNALSRKRRSGVLCVSFSEDIRKSVYWEQGAIVFASSTDRNDRIGECLMRQGMLSQNDFFRASLSMGQGRRFGQILVELGVMTEKEFQDALMVQILDIVFSLFLLPEGEFEFTDHEQSVPNDLRLSLSTGSIILEGVRRIPDVAVVQRGIGDLNQIFIPGLQPMLDSRTLSLKPIERQLIEVITGPITLMDAVMLTQNPPNLTLKALYGLLSVGLLDRQAPAPGDNAAPEPPLTAALPPPVTHPLPSAPDASAPNPSGNLLAAMREKIERTTDPFIILGVSPGAARFEIRDAYIRLAKDFHPDRYRDAPPTTRFEVDTIFDRIREAYENLVSGPEEIARPSTGPLTPMQTGPLSLPASRSTGPLRPPESSSPSGSLTPPPARTTGPLSSPPSPPASSTGPLSPPSRSTGMLSMPGPASGTGPLPTPPPTSPLQITGNSLSREENAENLFEQARQRITERDYQTALACLREAVRLVPESGKYQLVLGTTLTAFPKFQSEAETVLRKAAELEPFNTRPLIALGQLYTRTGMNIQAEKAFRDALRIDPDSHAAKNGLAAVETEKPKGFLDRLFKG